MNLTASPLHLSDDELLRAQNVLPVGRELEDGLRKRDGMSRLVADPLAGAVLSITNIPLPAPDLGGAATQIWWLGMGPTTYTVAAGYDAAASNPLTGLSIYNDVSTRDGLVHFATSTTDLAQWDGTTVTPWVSIAADTFYGISNWRIQDYVAHPDDGIYVLIGANTSPGGTLITINRAIILVAPDGTKSTISAIRSETYDLFGVGGHTSPAGPIVLWDGAIYTGSTTARGGGAGAGVWSTKIFRMTLAGGAWSEDVTFAEAADFSPVGVTARWEERGNALWYGQRVNDGTTKPYLYRYDGTWTQIEQAANIGRGGYAPIYAAGETVLLVLQETIAGVATLTLRESVDGGGSFSALDSWQFDPFGWRAVSRGTVFAGKVRFGLISTLDTLAGSRTFFTYSPAVEQYEVANSGVTYRYDGTVVQP